LVVPTAITPDRIVSMEPRLQRVTSAEFVATELRRAILEGQLLPGERIHQEDWAERFNMSRAPLREGLKLLSDQQLIRHDPNRGYFVAVLPPPEVAQLYWLRVRLESEVFRTIMPATNEQMDLLSVALEESVAASARRDAIAGVAAERRFTFGIYDLSPFDFLVREAKRLWEMTDPYRVAVILEVTPDGLSNLRRQRTSQLEAVRRHDSAELVRLTVAERNRLLERHLRNWKGPALSM